MGEEHIAKVKFWDLGRSKAQGEFEVMGSDAEINDEMYRQFSKHLLSSDISFDDGKIFAGCRCVGNYIAAICPVVLARE